MGEVTLERAEDLLLTARSILEGDRVAGIAGLSYQAVEAAAVHLIKIVNGHDPGGHYKRAARASELLHLCKDEMERLWKLRNIDFYGNELVGEPERSIGLDEAKDSLETAMRLVAQVKSLLAEVL
jgi:HEPN domain-containing protein